MFSFETVIYRRWVRCASRPKLFYELVPFFICRQMKKSATFLRRNNIDSILRQPKSRNLGKTCNGLILTLSALCAVRRIEARSSLDCCADSLFSCEHTNGLPILRHHGNGKAERREKKSEATSWQDANHLKALSIEDSVS